MSALKDISPHQFLKSHSKNGDKERYYSNWCRDIYSRRELLLNLVVRNLKIRYKGSILGFFWSLLDPLFMMLVYLFFIKLMRFSIELPVLLVGIIAWQFFIMCANDSVHSITGNTNLVKKVYFPRVILPLSMVVANLINFMLSIAVLMVLLLSFKVIPGVALLWFPAIVVLQFMLCMGISLIVSCSNVYFRDTEHLIGVMLMTWFFMTPIIYSISKVPEKYINFYFLNPMASLITVYRYSFLGKALPEQGNIWLGFVVAIVFFLVGCIIFSKKQKYFGDEL